MNEIVEYCLITNWKLMTILIPAIIIIIEIGLKPLKLKENYKFFLVIPELLRFIILVAFAMYSYTNYRILDVVQDAPLRLTQAVISLAIIIALNAAFEKLMKLYEDYCA